MSHLTLIVQELQSGKRGAATSSSGWTPLEPETPPISPPLTSLFRVEAGARLGLASASRTWAPAEVKAEVKTSLATVVNYKRLNGTRQSCDVEQVSIT